MAGIKDVAKRAGVGVGTVSRAVNNTGYVADETRKKIDKAMKELNYIPNELARNLYHSRTGIVGILVPTIAHPFFSEFVNYAENELYERGYKTMICNTNKEKNYELEYLEMLKRHIVDGLITGVHSLNSQVYASVNKPIVALDRYIDEKIPVVAVDHNKAGRMAAEELYNSRCKAVIQFSQAKQVEAPALERYISFEKFLIEKGVKVYTYELEINRFEIDYFMKVCREVFEKYPEIDGVFGTDLLAMCYMKISQEHGRHIPENLKVIAYDGTYITDVYYPNFTIIKQPIQKLAAESARLIVNKIEGKEYYNRKVQLEASIIRGDTTTSKIL
ncbi:MAG: LacI family DNA-binding transcriptional regulator [Suipraeoptans sp.]